MKPTSLALGGIALFLLLTPRRPMADPVRPALPKPPTPSTPPPPAPKKPATTTAEETRQRDALQFAQEKFWAGASAAQAVEHAVAEYKRRGGKAVGAFRERATRYPWSAD